MEFGSDFHALEFPEKGSSKLCLPKGNLYALGRHALFEIIRANNIETLWVPSYYCMDSLHILEGLNVSIRFYENLPDESPAASATRISPRDTDAVLLMNLFGLWGNCQTPDLGCTVIEDHSHDLLSNWAKNSSADYCFASLRKTIPIAEGGILWSPSYKQLPPLPADYTHHAENASSRWEAMDLKRKYIGEGRGDKNSFLSRFRNSEEEFNHLAPAPIFAKDLDVIENFDLKLWYGLKKRNWQILYSSLSDFKGNYSSQNFDILFSPDFFKSNTVATPFSLLLLFENPESRNKAREKMIHNGIYPAILWPLPPERPLPFSFSERMLSIHCDGRYTPSEIHKLADFLTNL